MSSDEKLVRRAVAGDRRAFAAIFERYHQDLYRFSLALLGNPQDAQDALQSTMLKALRALPGEEREIRLKPWLYRIARNESMETLRRRRDHSDLEHHEPTVAGLAETAETRERLRALLDDLEHLPERQRATLVMRELAGLDYKQIGASLGSSAEVARQTLYEARLSLRQIEAGREMRCDEVMRKLSDDDGRVIRRREIQAHLHSCADCRAFRDGIVERHRDLAALAPLPLAPSIAVLQGILGKGAGIGAAGTGATGGTATGAGIAGGKMIGTSALLKIVAGVAMVAVGVGAARHDGLIGSAPSGNPKATRSASPAAAADRGGVAEPLDLQASRGPLGPRYGERDDGPASPGTVVKDASGRGTKQPSAAAWQNPGSQYGEDLPSESEAGKHPPGGGFGRSRGADHGPPAQLPAAADHGQETAASHRAARPSPRRPEAAASPGGKGGSSTASRGGSAQSAETTSPGAPSQSQSEHATGLAEPPSAPPTSRSPSTE